MFFGEKLRLYYFVSWSTDLYRCLGNILKEISYQTSNWLCPHCVPFTQMIRRSGHVSSKCRFFWQDGRSCLSTFFPPKTCQDFGRKHNTVQEKIYRKNEMVFCSEKWSDLLWEKITLVIEKNFCKFDCECQYFIPTVKSQRNKICAFLKLRYCEKTKKLLSNVKTSWRFLWPF